VKPAAKVSPDWWWRSVQRHALFKASEIGLFHYELARRHGDGWKWPTAPRLNRAALNAVENALGDFSNLLPDYPWHVRLSLGDSPDARKAGWWEFPGALFPADATPKQVLAAVEQYRRKQGLLSWPKPNTGRRRRGVAWTAVEALDTREADTRYPGRSICRFKLQAAKWHDVLTRALGPDPRRWPKWKPAKSWLANAVAVK
jgi:hypothetical protein